MEEQQDDQSYQNENGHEKSAEIDSIENIDEYDIDYDWEQERSAEQSGFSESEEDRSADL